ncbi:hypothetical protein L228DRAFT_268391 [Xylona heveae TC161]|uniref:Uncharacterized protein n=1 Tax=Xylona heveae (strain CBS 132557 / TC161) TaxID=1328760 RepID=A0A161TBH1_XYLHT|nr:hypothetical protein L228DRAFT_268391 [Xylona heveae TC161]KZF23027.1 hypothetical protein L228DRAFT_268391 [Xylona heveae TC161]
MSDEEDYYGDDDEYIYYDDEPLDVVDDLAEHTMHSPVWQEDPRYETLDYFSDWDYYSDDFYDEDSSLRKPNVQLTTASNLAEGIQPLTVFNSKKGTRQRINTRHQNKRGTNPKISQKHQQWYPKVVWKSRPVLHKPPLIDPSDAETVALFENWRETFGENQTGAASPVEENKPAKRTGKDLRTKTAKSEPPQKTKTAKDAELTEQPNRGDALPQLQNGKNWTTRKRKAADINSDERKSKALRSSTSTNLKENLEDTPSKSTRSRKAARR